MNQEIVSGSRKSGQYPQANIDQARNKKIKNIARKIIEECKLFLRLTNKEWENIERESKSPLDK